MIEQRKHYLEMKQKVVCSFAVSATFEAYVLNVIFPNWLGISPTLSLTSNLGAWSWTLAQFQTPRLLMCCLHLFSCGWNLVQLIICYSVSLMRNSSLHIRRRWSTGTVFVCFMLSWCTSFFFLLKLHFITALCLPSVCVCVWQWLASMKTKISPAALVGEEMFEWVGLR